MDHNANHVIQKCLEINDREKIDFILESIIEEVYIFYTRETSLL